MSNEQGGTETGGEVAPAPADTAPAAPADTAPAPADTAPAAPADTAPAALADTAPAALADTAPAAPADTAPVAPDAPTEVEIEDEPVPLGVLEDEEDGLREIEDEEVPQMTMELAGGLHHTFQHICELIASGIFPIFLFGSNRKKRKELSELKDQLEDETGGKKN